MDLRPSDRFRAIVPTGVAVGLVVTIVDVAREAGVSTSTVSRVLDERLPRSQIATAERVRKAAAEARLRP